MSANLKKAIKKYGMTEFSRWMLDDGSFLGVADYDDHRIVGEFCTVSWLDFIKKDCVSVHFDTKANYLWLRLNGDLNFQQRQSFKYLIENEYIHVEELNIHVYDGDKYQEDFTISNGLAELFLTDKIAYECEKEYA